MKSSNPRSTSRNPTPPLKLGQAEQLRRAIKCSQAGDRLTAGQLLFDLAQSAPEHPQVLRWYGIELAASGEWAKAAACLKKADALITADFALRLLLAQAESNAHDFRAARQSLHSAQACAQGAAHWLALTLEFDRQGLADEALAAVNQLLALDPTSSVALLQRARSASALGDATSAAADYRTLISRGQLLARAWFALVDLKIVPLSKAEQTQLQTLSQDTSLETQDRMLLQFALGKALEDAGQVELAFEALRHANAEAHKIWPWDASAFSRQTHGVRAAFDGAHETAQAQGKEIIFLVGLPRSGTTLVEQVLASHSQVEGASELPYLRAVIDEESRRMGTPFPSWVGSASREDWTRMGRRYLSLSARWRAQRPVSTDKLPENWLLAGAALAMLPEAVVIDCRRDATETSWSCYKQLFGPHHVAFTYSFQTLAAYWHDYDDLCQFWAHRYGARFHVQHYERLVAEPEAQIRALLLACGLPFEAGCMEFHKAQRAIRTPSALQVRQPMKKTSTPAAQYGHLLDPLRQLLSNKRPV